MCAGGGREGAALITHATVQQGVDACNDVSKLSEWKTDLSVLNGHITDVLEQVCEK